jgi:PAS domain S-box-containing protein
VRYLADDNFIALLETLLDAAPDAMMCVDSDGRIVLANAQVEMLFGYRPRELTGQPVEMLVPDGARPAHPAHRAACGADPGPRSLGTRTGLAGRRRDGSTFPAEISLSAIDTDEGLVVTAVRDVSQRLRDQAERERLQSAADRARLESLGQLAGGVAHDFNNLLGVILNYAAFVRDEVAKDPPQVQWQAVRADIAQVERAAQRAAGLTRQLLAFARRGMLQPRVFSLNDVLADLQPTLVRTLGEHVKLVTILADDLGDVLADRGQIEQVVINLAVNARDSMPDGGILTIETANTQTDNISAPGRVGLAAGHCVSMTVCDTGTGIPHDVMDRVFEPFFSTKAKGEGTGLGLATAYGIIQQASGNLRIYSEPGLGTTVTALLPVTDRLARSGGPPRQASSAGHGQRVLVVEDEPAMREVTRRLLERSGYRVLTASSGPEAIDMITGQPAPVDLLLTDVVMPQMLGKEVAQRIRALQPGIRVLFMSGYAQGVLGRHGVLEPGVNLIEKPFSESSLMAKLLEVLTTSA